MSFPPQEKSKQRASVPAFLPRQQQECEAGLLSVTLLPGGLTAGAVGVVLAGLLACELEMCFFARSLRRCFARGARGKARRSLPRDRVGPACRRPP